MAAIQALLSVFIYGLSSLINSTPIAPDPYCAEPQKILYKTEQVIHRTSLGFTEGLVYHSGYLYESTGQYGQSALNRINPKSGEVTVLSEIPDSIFGEGLDFWRGSFMQLTFREELVLLWSDGPSSPPKYKHYPRQGWGLTHDVVSWITSNGTNELHFLDPNGLTLRRILKVRRDSILQDHLNELEYVNGKIFANVFPTDEIVRIDSQSGCIDAVVDLLDLRSYFSSEEEDNIASDSQAVANGIAYDPIQEMFYVTGKNWPLIFKLKLNAFPDK